MKVQDRGYFEQRFAANFDANAALAASKVVCTEVLRKTLDEAFRTLVLPNVEVKLSEIRDAFIRQIKLSKEVGTLSEAAFVAAKNAITKAIGDCDPNILMFKKGVKRFCSNAGAATAGTSLFLITARNAIILHEPLSSLVQQGLEGRSNEGLMLYNDFLGVFQGLSNAEIVAAENALNAFENGGVFPASDVVMQELSELGIDINNPYIETPQHLFGSEVKHLGAFLNREMKERRRMVAMAASGDGAQSTGKADHSVCNGVMSLAKRYIPGAEQKLKNEQKEKDEQRELNYQEKVRVLNPVIDDWEQKNAELFNTTTGQIQACIDLIIASQYDLSKNDIITELVLSQSKKVHALRTIVDSSCPDRVQGWSSHLDTKEWIERVASLNDDLKKKFREINVNKINLAFQRVSRLAVDLILGQGAEVESIRNQRPALRGLSNTMISTLVLVWMAIHDRTKVLGAGDEILADSPENGPQIDSTIKIKEMNLVRAFWEFQTEYAHGRACAHGSYNKIVESLSLTDPDVRIGNDIDVSFERVLAIIDEKFVKKLVLETAKGFDEQELFSAWESKTPSTVQRALLKNFRDLLHRELIDKLPEVLKMEFTDFHAGLEYQHGVEAFVLQRLIPAIEKNIVQHSVVEAPPAQAWVRPFLEEETYEQALRRLPSCLPFENRRARALRAVFKNQIACRMEKVLLTSGMQIHRTEEETDIFEDDALHYANDWAEELLISARDENFNPETVIIELVNQYEIKHPGTLQSREKLIKSLVDVFCSQQNLLNFFDLSGLLGELDAQRLANVGVAKPFSALNVPLLPSVFPFNPLDAFSARANNGIPSFSVAATIQEPRKDQIPSGVLEQLSANGVPLANLKMFFCVQNMPWWYADTRLLLRPHPWLRPQAPADVKELKELNEYKNQIQVGLSDIGLSFSTLGTIEEVSVGKQFMGFEQIVVYSGEPKLEITGISSEKNSNGTHCFYSLCIDGSANPKRAALTLHWLLKDEDHKKISELLKDTSTLEGFSKKVELLRDAVTLNQRINGISPVEALNAMLQGGQPEAQPSGNHKYQLFEQPVPTMAMRMHLPPVAPGWREEKLLQEEVAARRIVEPVPVMHFPPLAPQPVDLHVPAAANAVAQRDAEAGRAEEERRRQEAERAAQVQVQQAAEARAREQQAREDRERQDAAAARALQEAEARRVEEARLAEVERLRLAPAPAPAPRPLNRRGI